MREIPVPADAAAQARRAASLKRRYRCALVFSYIFGALAFGCLAALVVTVFVFELQRRTGEILYSALAGAFCGGSVLFGALVFLFAKLTDAAARRRLDYLERCDGEESFTVGEDVLATFGTSALLLHGAGKEIPVPYADLRFLSVCSRRRPREKGEWSVVIGIPARYLLKDPKPNDPPRYVQTDAKERLYRAIAAHGLVLEGEQRSERKGKFRRKKTFSLPDRAKRRGACVSLIAGGVLAAGGALLAAFYNATVGAIGCAVALVFLIRGTRNFLGAKRRVGVYEEGLYLREENFAESLFLKWEEIERISRGEGTLVVATAYGECEFPLPDGAYEYLAEGYAEKCGGQDGSAQ